MNSQGGILIIGVDDDKNVLGLEKDLEQLRRHTLDSFELHFTNIINQYLGKIFRLSTKITFEKINEKDIVVVIIEKAKQPVYVKHGREKQFYIRSGNSCQPLDIEEASEYIRDRWPNI